MRRRLAALLIPLATLSACATAGGPPGPVSGEMGAVSATYRNPMRVRLFEDRNQLVIRVNRPAHTAVFEIFPGQGIALISPEFGNRELVRGGTRIFSNYTRNRFWAYDNVRANPYSYANLYSQPRHLLVIASEKPLRTERFRASAGMLRRAMGTSSYTSLNSNRVVDDVLATVVQPQPDDNWDADVLTVWPADGGTRLPRGDLYHVRCSDGSMLWVPLELAAAACRNPEKVLRGTPPPARPDSVSPAEGTPRRPGGTRPAPEPSPAEPNTPSVETRETRMTRTGDDARSYRRVTGESDGAAARDVRLSELQRNLAVRRTMSAGGTRRLGDGTPRIPQRNTDYTSVDSPRLRPPPGERHAATEGSRPPPMERSAPESSSGGEGGSVSRGSRTAAEP